VPYSHPLSFAKADMELCFNRIDDELKMPASNIHFPKADTKEYINSWEGVRCVVMQGGQGDIKHWAFNDPVKREGKYKDEPPNAAGVLPAYNARCGFTSGYCYAERANQRRWRGYKCARQAITVGPVQTWKAEKVSIWQPGTHDNPFGMRLTTLMLSKKIADSSVPMSLLAGHPNVQFNFYRPAIGKCEAQMH